MKLTGLLFGLIGAMSFSFAEITPLHCGDCGPEKKECSKEKCDKEKCDKEDKECDKEKECCGECQKEDKEA